MLKRKVIFAIFSVFLVASQLLAALHAVDFDAHAQSDSCEICLLANGLGHGLFHHNNISIAVPDDDFFQAPTIQSGHLLTILSFLARAPPTQILPSVN